MSKDSYAPGELIGVIRFVFNPTQSRTLNATQAYDSNPSQIVLASYPATSTIKTPAKSLGKVLSPNLQVRYAGFAAVTGTVYPADEFMDNERQPLFFLNAATVELAFSPVDLNPVLGSKKENPDTTFIETSTANFSGTGWDDAGGVLVGSLKRKSNANKDIFYGAITVGTLLYKEWQGKYAVLKVDLLTNNAILRVYNS